MTKLMTKAEVCEILQVSESTLERIVADGDLQALRIRSQLRFLEQDLLRYLSRCAEPSQALRASSPKGGAKRGGRARRGEVVEMRRYIPGMKVV